MKKYIIVFIVLLITYSVKSQSFKIIVNNANSITSLKKTDISNFLLKKRTKWGDGTEIIPVDLNSKSAVRESLSKDIHGKTTAQVRAFWQQSVFSGKSTPPREFENDNSVVEFVKANKGAIGYISASSNSDGVKTINFN